MFFPERVKNIKRGDRVLEIGPGSSPHPRSNVLLEKKFASPKEAEAQRGYVPNAKLNTEVIYYEGGKFPFQDKEFDYVICSHVLEHIPSHELQLFISELQRVANKGYIEFPNIFYELINYQNVHLWLMNHRDNKVIFLDKKQFKTNTIHRMYREMFYGSDKFMTKAFDRYKEFFFCSFEWEGTFQYETVDTFDELVNNYDFSKCQLYFSGYKNKMRIPSYFLNVFINKFKYIAAGIKHIHKMRSGYFVHKTAVLEKRSLITIGRRAEVNDYVIIRTFAHPVIIGAYTQINPFTVIYGGCGVVIGDNVMIAPHCMIAAGDHDYKQTDKPIRFAGSINKGPIIIEDNVWIGANCTITDGVRIGRDAVVAANSVITDDVQPFDIVGGVTAKVIANRKHLKK